MKTVIFDLDGTLSDPSQGITGAINHALLGLGLQRRPADELLRFIGPPLRDIFETLLPGEGPGAVKRAVGFFREYYRSTGYRQNVLYPGIRDVLDQLAGAGCRLCLATGKKTVTALDVLDHFSLADYFDTVLGCGDGGTKTGLMEEILGSRRKEAVMVGDRDIDFLAAAETGIPSVGVAWGFGGDEELALASALCPAPEELPAAVFRVLARE